MAAVGGLALAATAVSVAGTASAAQGPKPWRIGLEGPITGSQAAVGTGMLDGAILAAENLNAHGGLLGRPVQIVPIDDQADPTVGVKVVTAALRAGLDGVVGPYNSGVGAKVLPLYTKAKIVPVAAKADHDCKFPKDVFDEAWKLGLVAPNIPEAYGGGGLSVTEASVILEEINRSGANSGACHAQMYTMGTVLRHGNAEQKQKYLPKLTSGEWLGCWSLTE